jgi:hypothetical protein
MIVGPDFPRLSAANHRITSEATPNYNCIAWTANDMEHWWQPGIYWPTSTRDDDFGIATLAQAFLVLGYAECTEGGPEREFEKVALYGSSLYYTHAARQLPNGKWTSKLGRDVDIEP